MCVRSIAQGGQWEGVEVRGGARLSPGTFPDPPLALRCQHTLVNKKKVTKFCLAHHFWTSLYVNLHYFYSCFAVKVEKSSQNYKDPFKPRGHSF